MEVVELLNRKVASADEELQMLATTDPEVKALCTMPSVGPVTAAAFVATLDDAKRFKGAHQVEAYLGLVPSEMSSGEKQRRGHITKSGNADNGNCMGVPTVGPIGSTKGVWPT